MVSPTDLKTPDFDEIIPRRIVHLREVLEFTATDLDRCADFSLGTVRSLERKVQRVYAHHLIKISQATGVDLNYFYDATETSSPSNSAKHQEMFRLLEFYHQLDNATTKRNVFELIEEIALEQAE
ncbi:MAG: hypothetical protein COB46_10990 [Rhodospirillaceae bacterium]|nr:MAG: hypothetical protein COB46_10990 [Rhodospirillaceae bacterium]